MNNCKVGIDKKENVIRKKFEGKKENVIKYILMLDEEIRGNMESMGIRKLKEMIGRKDILRVCEKGKMKEKKINLSIIMKNELNMRNGVKIVGGYERKELKMEKRMENEMIEEDEKVLKGVMSRDDIEMNIKNEEREFYCKMS